MTLRVHQKKYKQYWQIVGKSLMALLFSLFTLSEPVQGQRDNSENNARDPNKGGEGTPVPSIPPSGGGTRPGDSKCPDSNIPVISFLPRNTNVKVASAFPIFWFYIPFTPNEVDSFVFILEERNGGLISQEDPRILRTERMDFSETPGFIQLRLPSDKLLEFGQSYKWRLLVYCDPNNEDDFITMSGAIAPTEPNFQLRSQLASSSPLDRVDLYLQNEYWYDAFSLLATLRSEEPNNTELLNVWEWFFQEFELEEISSEAISPCCLVEDAGRDVR